MASSCRGTVSMHRNSAVPFPRSISGQNENGPETLERALARLVSD
ncbi:hypothetical protein I552_8862 [Mycobacterium xenopi 3993]|nr:hypothetical protein I552_8862 [Mycobacterium xenopi 3993]